MGCYGHWRFQFPSGGTSHGHRKDSQKNGARSCRRPGSGGIATMPTNQPKKRTKQTRTQAHTRTHSHTREISEGNVGSEAQFFARENEVEFQLSLRFPVGLLGHLSKTPTGELALRWPDRPVATGPCKPESVGLIRQISLWREASA